MDFGKALRAKLDELRYPPDHPLIEWSEVYPLPIVGCASEEIDAIKSVQGIKDRRLPEIYAQFLRELGKKCGDLFIGYDLTYRFLSSYSFRDAINDSLIRFGRNVLSEDQYVFMNLQSASHWYFTLDHGDDPPVFAYWEPFEEDDDPMKDGPVKVASHLSEFLTEFIAERESKDSQREFLDKYAVPLRE